MSLQWLKTIYKKLSFRPRSTGLCRWCSIPKRFESWGDGHTFHNSVNQVLEGEYEEARLQRRLGMRLILSQLGLERGCVRVCKSGMSRAGVWWRGRQIYELACRRHHGSRVITPARDNQSPPRSSHRHGATGTDGNSYSYNNNPHATCLEL